MSKSKTESPWCIALQVAGAILFGIVMSGFTAPKPNPVTRPEDTRTEECCCDKCKCCPCQCGTRPPHQKCN